jgi:GAF domain
MGSCLTEKAGGNPHATEDLRDPRPDAARKRLRECTDQRDACEAIREIVSNLLGCEEMALFQFDRQQKKFSLIWSFGINQKTPHLEEMLREPALSAVIAGRAHIGNGDSEAQNPSQGETARAFVPIEFRGETAAVLVLLRLLPQKAKIDELDRELFAVLSREAGNALFGGAPSRPARRERKR